MRSARVVSSVMRMMLGGWTVGVIGFLAVFGRAAAPTKYAKNRTIRNRRTNCIGDGKKSSTRLRQPSRAKLTTNDCGLTTTKEKADLAAGLKCCSAFAPARNRTESPTGLRGAHLYPHRSARTVRSSRYIDVSSGQHRSSHRRRPRSDSGSLDGSTGRRSYHRI